MGEIQAQNWRREQRVIQEPDIIVPEEKMEENRQARIRQEQMLQVLSYRSEGTYTRDPKEARDQKGSIRIQEGKPNKRYAHRHLAAGLLASILILGVGVGYAQTRMQGQESITQMEMMEAEELGLTPELLQALKENASFFEYFDPKQTIREETVLAKITEMSELKDRVLAQKLGALFDVPYYEVEPGEVFYTKDGDFVAQIQVGKDLLLRNHDLPFFQKNDISREIIEYLESFHSLEDLVAKVRKDHISKTDAIKRLGKDYFSKIEKMAKAKFSKDKNNNVRVSYEQEKDKKSEENVPKESEEELER